MLTWENTAMCNLHSTDCKASISGMYCMWFQELVIHEFCSLQNQFFSNETGFTCKWLYKNLKNWYCTAQNFHIVHDSFADFKNRSAICNMCMKDKRACVFGDKINSKPCDKIVLAPFFGRNITANFIQV